MLNGIVAALTLFRDTIDDVLLTLAYWMVLREPVDLDETECEP